MSDMSSLDQAPGISQRIAVVLTLGQPKVLKGGVNCLAAPSSCAHVIFAKLFKFLDLLQLDEGVHEANGVRMGPASKFKFELLLQSNVVRSKSSH